MNKLSNLSKFTLKPYVNKLANLVEFNVDVVVFEGVKYKLLKDEEVIRIGDECLTVVGQFMGCRSGYYWRRIEKGNYLVNQHYLDEHVNAIRREL